MTAISDAAPALPPGPAAAFDLNTTEESFHYIPGVLAEHGDIVRVRPESRTADSYLINHPDYVKHVLVSNHKNYIKGVGFERVKMLLGNGIIVTDGEFWHAQRKMIQPAFHRNVIAAMAGRMAASNLAALPRWQRLADAAETINITDTMSELSLEVILHAIFGDDLERLIERLGHNPFSILVEHSERDLQLAVRFRGLQKLVAEIIAERRTGAETSDERPDFLAMLMAARHPRTGEPMSDAALIDEVMTLIVAGHETTATTLNWTWYLLCNHPEAEARMQTEIDAVVGDATPGIEHVGQLTYTGQVLEEALRLYPPVWLYTRKAVNADRLGPYDVAPGTDIFITPYYLHRHPDFWDAPEAFRPERFAPEAVAARHRHVHIPFSAGPRRCIGDHFAMVEMKIHLALMARRFRLRLQAAEPVELEPAVNLRSRQPLHMSIEPRTP